MATETGDSFKLVQELTNKYNTPVPRYTSYPTALEFDPKFDENLYFQALSSVDNASDVSIYIHIPFCRERCYYCGCNVIISKRDDMIDPFLGKVFDEMDFVFSKTSGKPSLVQLHFGGGTPNFLRPSDWQQIREKIAQYVTFDNSCEMSIEIDPVYADRAYLESLKSAGFNRVSFGVQDINTETLEAIGRIQDISHVEDLITFSRELGFESVNVDFMYGLPTQTVASFERNLEWIQKMKPDRIAMFSYAHIPWLKKHQNKMPLDKLPEPEEKLKIYLNTRSFLQNMGYLAIGMDHYALPGDPISDALDNKRLHRNFMGYTTRPDVDMIAFGPSAISCVNGVYAQNHTKLRAYEKAVMEKTGFFEKGYKLSDEDRLRSRVIQSIMNNLYLDIPEINSLFDVSFSRKFAAELERLAEYAEEGLLELLDDAIVVTEKGRHVVRHIASVFDEYRKKAPAEKNQRFSKGI